MAAAADNTLLPVAVAADIAEAGNTLLAAAGADKVIRLGIAVGLERGIRSSLVAACLGGPRSRVVRRVRWCRCSSLLRILLGGWVGVLAGLMRRMRVVGLGVRPVWGVLLVWMSCFCKGKVVVVVVV